MFTEQFCPKNIDNDEVLRKNCLSAFEKKSLFFLK